MFVLVFFNLLQFVCFSMAPPASRAATQQKVRVHGNAAVDALPELVQEWYHAVSTPLGIGNIDWAKDCIRRGVDVDARLDAFGGTALFVAVEQGNWAMMRYLVEEAGAALELADYGGYTALDYAAACHQHHPEKPPILRDGTLAPMDIASYLKSKGMQYTWFGAALAEDIDRLWEFLENGQDVNELGGHFRRNAAEEALDNGNIYTARFLMVKGGTMGPQPRQFEPSGDHTCTAVVSGKLALKA
eukprot:TRINITY_DN11508_c0_g1_i1.p1 TRINITY_DN11508_c0_g1~~TRINITY_DN11508_c0_g1_i1.p1  ORF type:complete len:244 (+),score=62.50 TRINITY_DN11508_c0_g1_i1:65-796(+)